MILAEITPTAGGMIGAGTVLAGGLIAAAIKLFGRKNGTPCPIPEHVTTLRDHEHRVTQIETHILYLVTTAEKEGEKLGKLSDAIQGQRIDMARYFKGKTAPHE